MHASFAMHGLSDQGFDSVDSQQRVESWDLGLLRSNWHAGPVFFFSSSSSGVPASSQSRVFSVVISARRARGRGDVGASKRTWEAGQAGALSRLAEAMISSY